MKVAWWLCRDQSREQRGQMWKYSARANLREDSKDKSAITAQENTDRPLLAKSAITIKQIVIFAISPNFQQHSTLPETLVSSAICKLMFLKLENQFWLQGIFETMLTLNPPCKTDKLTNTVGKIFVYICTLLMLTATSGLTADSKTRVSCVCIWPAGSHSMNWGAALLICRRRFMPDFMFVLASDPRKT